MTEKTSLTPEERIKAAYLHIVRGIAQHDVAVAFGVNQGRIAEAVAAIALAAENPKGVRRIVDADAAQD